MYGRNFGKGGRRGGGFGRGRGRGAYGPGYARGDWRTGFTPAAWEVEAWGGPPPWARRWGIDLPAAERKAWLEQAKAHLQERLAEIEQELQALDASATDQD